MKKIIFTAVILSVISVVANAQIRNTLTGVEYNGNSNLKFPNKHAENDSVSDKEKLSVELAVGGLYSASKNANAAGVNMEVDAIFHKNPSFAWVLGGLGTAEYNKDFGLMADLGLLGGVRLGRKAYFQFAPMFLVGQTPYRDFSYQVGKPENFNEYTNTAWSLKGGAQATLGLPLGKGFALRFDARYSYALVTGNRKYQEADNWVHNPTEYSKGKFTGIASLVVPLNVSRQESGDNDWQIALNSGYSFTGSKGFVVEGEIFHVNRPSFYKGIVLGGGVSQTIDGSVSYGAVYGKAGLQYYPIGADSEVVLEGGLKAGIGEFAKNENFYTQEGTYSLTGEAKNIGVFGKAYASVILNFGKNAFKLTGEGGVGTTFGASTENVPGSAVHLDGGSYNHLKPCGAVTIGYIRRI